MWDSQKMGALEKDLKPTELLSLGAPIFPTTYWLQGEGTGSEHLADQSCDRRHNEQGNEVGGAEPWGPHAPAKAQNSWKAISLTSSGGGLDCGQICKASGSSSHPPPPRKAWSGCGMVARSPGPDPLLPGPSPSVFTQMLSDQGPQRLHP